jgi:hypothetical protein
MKGQYMKSADPLQQKAYDLLFKRLQAVMKESKATDFIAFEVYLNAMCYLAAKLDADEENLAKGVKETVAHYKSEDGVKKFSIN